MATRYDNLRRLVERLETDPMNYPNPSGLIEELRKAAAGGARYRKLYNRAKQAAKAPRTPQQFEQQKAKRAWRKLEREGKKLERERRKKNRRKRKQLQGIDSVTPREARGRELTGGFRTVSGGLPSTKR